MKDLNKIGEELFSKLRGRFKNITIGNQEGVITNVPGESRFYDFRYGDNGGKVSVSLDEKSVVIMYSEDLFDADNTSLKKDWYNFLKEIRVFAKKRLLNFEVRDIQKSNLEKRDYKFLSTKNGENTMTESTMYGTSKTSYQNIADARICVKHSESINQELAGGRSQKIGSIYIESANGERFKYPYKHLNGARAMARHVAEGGNMYDDFGKHITGLSEEMNKLRKFKTYMSRSSVMAEGLAGYMDVVNERIDTVKTTIAKLQNKAHYTEATENFTIAVMEDVPEDVATDWTAQLTIKQFNEELKSVFPYIYKLVSEANTVTELGPEDILGEADADKQDNGTDKMDVTDADKKANTPAYKRMMAGDKRYNDKTTKESTIPTEADIDAGFEEMMGQFSEKAKPDFLDMDGDGDKEEPMKKAIDDKEDGDEDTNEAQDGQVGTMALFVSDRDGGEHEVEVQVKIENGKPEIDPNTLPGPEDDMYWDDADIEQQAMDAMKNGDIEFDEGNAYAHAVKKAKMNGKKKGDKIDGPDGDEITLEKDQKVALPEKILSLFDREQGTFPKGETAVLTMVEKDYGEQYIAPAKQFIEQIMQKYESVMQGPAVQEMEDEHEPEKVTLAVTADINALKRAAGIGESERPASNDKSVLDIKALAGL
jgi:hypothetical protein